LSIQKGAHGSRFWRGSGESACRFAPEPRATQAASPVSRSPGAARARRAGRPRDIRRRRGRQHPLGQNRRRGRRAPSRSCRRFRRASAGAPAAAPVPRWPPCRGRPAPRKSGPARPGASQGLVMASTFSPQDISVSIPKALPQGLGQHGAGKTGPAPADEQLAAVEREKLRRQSVRAQHPQAGQRGGRLVKAVQAFIPAREQRRPVLAQNTGAAVERGQQRVGRRARLKNIELPLDLVLDARLFRQHAAQMQPGGLREARQRLVRALDHEVGSARKSALGKTRRAGKPQVRPVGLVHDERHVVFMAEGGNRRNIRHRALVGGAGHDDTAGVRAFGERPPDVLRRDAAPDRRTTPPAGGSSQRTDRPPSSMAWKTDLWQLRAAITRLPAGARARTAASRPPVLPFTRYHVRFAPYRAAVRAPWPAARMPFASCRSSVSGSSVKSIQRKRAGPAPARGGACGPACAAAAAPLPHMASSCRQQNILFRGPQLP
jgi:hypothetical protein